MSWRNRFRPAAMTWIYAAAAVAALSVSTGAAAVFQSAVDSIERYRAALQANPDDARAKEALKQLIDRPDPVPVEANERIRGILRAYPWRGKARLVFDGEPGTPLVVSGVVRDTSGAPVGNALLNVFQADASGVYTRAAAMDEPHARLFAFIRTGGD